MTRPVRIAPSILSADFSRLGAEIEAVVEAGADVIHLDVMDGHFVPNITFGAPVVAALRGCTDRPFDVHLMIAPTDPYLDGFIKAGADTLTVHAEAGPHLHRSLARIRDAGRRASVAINPATHESALTDVLDMIDQVIVMGVNPGFGGQCFIPGTLPKVARVRAMLEGRDVDIMVDGGVTAENDGALARAGATVLVAGAAVFRDGAEGYRHNIAALRDAANTITV